jgi:methylated-DNA-[protein]-cysteine S-methyltransferase
MTLIVDWRSSTEVTANVIRVNTEFAALDVYLSGVVIQKTVWCCLQQGLYQENDSAIAQQINKYLQNPNSIFLTVELKKQGTEFGNRVWNELCKIPFGQTITYSEMANRIDSGARVPGIIPCHRVVSVSGIGGFMGQSQGEFIEIKRRLIEYEAFVIEQGNGKRVD